MKNKDVVVKAFKHVTYKWEEQKAASLYGDEVGLLLYRSNLLGADLRITNYGGGNTSCRTIEKDPLTNQEVEVMWIKGSGGDIGTLTKVDLAGLYVDRLRSLKSVYKGIEHEDEMVPLFNHCIFDLNSKAPSIDTPLHALLPFKHIDHLHPDAIIAIAASKDGEKITRELWKNRIEWIPWQRPGFDLGLQLEKCLNNHPNIRGIILGGHGLFTWGDTAFECYLNSLEVIETASEYIHSRIKKTSNVFGGQKVNSLGERVRKDKAAYLAPLFRGMVSQENAMIGHFTDQSKVLEFVNSNNFEKLAPLGTSCPDHFLRTKIKPLIIYLADIDFENTVKTKKKLETYFESYRKDYKSYYENHKHYNSPAIRDANPVIILVPQLGLFAFAKNKQTARVASEFYVNAINVMRGAEAISSYISLPKQEAFNIEYWLLEEAKLQRMPKEQPLSRKIALVTGAGGGIGKAISDVLISAGAVVVGTDLFKERLEESFKGYSNDYATYKTADVTKAEEISNIVKQACLDFGGVDIVVHCAGLAKSKSLMETDESDWDILQNVIVKGQFNLFKHAVTVMKRQGLGGDLIAIGSKNGLFAGPNNVAYGTAKAAQQHMARLLGAELGADGIKVNIVNPDGVIVGSKIWEGKWAEGRAKAYGITVAELPEFYAKRNLLNEIIYPKDIADAVYALTAVLKKSTGNMINVDGGIANAFTR